MVNFGDFIGHTNKERVRNALNFAWLIIFASFFILWCAGIGNEWKYGPSDDLLLLGIPINTKARYISLIPFMLFTDISLLFLKLYPKSQSELYLVLPLEQIVYDYSRGELFRVGMETVITMGIIKFYNWIFLFNRFDLLLMSFIIKIVLIGIAFKYRISQMKFAEYPSEENSAPPPSSSPNKVLNV